MNLKRKIFFLTFFTAIIPILIISIITFFMFSGEIKKEKDEKIDLVHENIVKTVQTGIDTVSGILEHLTDVYNEKDNESTTLNLQEKNEDKFKYLIKHMEDIGRLEKSMNFVGFGSFDKKMIFDDKGEDQNLPLDFDPTIRPWYIGALNSKGIYLSKVFFHISSGLPIITLSKKIKSENKVDGVLVAMIDLSYIGQEISKFKIGNKGSFFIVDRNNKILADGGDNKENFGYISKMDLFYKNYLRIIKKTPTGKKYYYTRKIENLNVLLIGCVDENDVYSTIIELRFYVITIVLITIITIIILLTIISKNFDSSLNELSIIIKNISKGDYSKNIEELNKKIEGKNELNLINKSIKKMSYEIIKREEELKYISETDPLTGCFSRRAIINLIEKEIERSKIFDQNFSLIMLDLDRFKKVNDNFGHLFGDIVLKNMSEIILKNIKKTDMFGRYGGEEFLILLPNKSINEGIIISERLREIIEKMTWKHEIIITVSMGVVEKIPNDTLNSLLERADTLLYKAKNNGRNRVEH